jgi:hypothetical protein
LPRGSIEGDGDIDGDAGVEGDIGRRVRLGNVSVARTVGVALQYFGLGEIDAALCCERDEHQH